MRVWRVGLLALVVGIGAHHAWADWTAETQHVGLEATQEEASVRLVVEMAGELEGHTQHTQILVGNELGELPRPADKGKGQLVWAGVPQDEHTFEQAGKRCMVDPYLAYVGPYCAEEPANCSDCDADGVAECPGWCADLYRFRVVHACAPPGDAEYALWFAGEGSRQGWRGLFVEDVGQDCEALRQVKPGKRSCGCTKGGQPAGTAALLLLAALALRRRS